MFSNSEQFASATKALFESQIAALHTLNNKTIEGVEKTIALNLGAAKTSMENCIVVAKQLSAAKDPQEFFSLTAAQAKPTAEIMRSYGHDLSNIASGVRNEFSKAADAQFSDTKSKIAALVDNVAKSAPSGSEQAVAMMKSAIDHASTGYEQLTTATKQAVETVEAQVINTTERFSATTENAAPKAAKK